MNANIFFKDIYTEEKKGELDVIGECTISTCVQPGIIAFGAWVMCKDHARQYLEFRQKGREKNASTN